MASDKSEIKHEIERIAIVQAGIQPSQYHEQIFSVNAGWQEEPGDINFVAAAVAQVPTDPLEPPSAVLTPIWRLDYASVLILAQQGRDQAQYQLGCCYQFGEQGCLINEVKALEWYEKAAAQNNGCAQRSLGDMYSECKGGLPKDAARALILYQTAFENLMQDTGPAVTQFNLGLMYQSGRGVARNEATAVTWYQRAADQGYADAQFYLGVAYWNGRGVAQNKATAVTWYQRAADQGRASAQFYLGVMYANGQGVAKDESLACEGYYKAAEQGDADAKSELERLHPEEKKSPRS
jgi:TPR repeat protein